MRLHHATLLLVLLLAPLAACQSPQQRLEEAHRAYAVDDWSKAYAEADAAQRELQTPARQEAAYLAGMAAFRQDRLAEARVRFTVAEESTDRELSGKAKAMMGHLLEKQGDFAAAAGKYEEAAQRLTGDAAEKARAEAADARAKVTPAASVEVASAPSEDDEETVVQPRQTPAKPRAAPKKPAPKAPAKQAAKDTGKKSDAKTSGKGHTIQCGAYPQESQARKRAKDISDEAKRAGLPAPKVTRVTGRDGKRLWIVSVGSFPTREAAKKALAKLKVDHAEVLPALD